MVITLNDLLKATSRSFYLTLRVLPGAVRSQIGLAYLLARTTDTIADTEIVPLEQRLAALAELRGRILGQSEARLDFGELAQRQGLPAERALLERVEESLALLHTLSAADLALVRQVIDTITSGQELDLKRFAAPPVAADVRRLTLEPALDGASSRRLLQIQTEAELDDYTYRVAGCVGEFWTKICRAHLFPDAKLDEVQLLADGVRFGKGLQLVNILRDLPRDLRAGRCYIPAELPVASGLTPEDLLNPGIAPKFRPIYDSLLDRAEAHLAAGWAYTNALPTDQWRVRLACAWPILIGVRTIERLREGEVLDANCRIKVPRAEVQDLMLRSLFHVPFPGMFRKLWDPAAKPIGKAVASTPDLA